MLLPSSVTVPFWASAEKVVPGPPGPLLWVPCLFSEGRRPGHPLAPPVPRLCVPLGSQSPPPPSLVSNGRESLDFYLGAPRVTYRPADRKGWSGVLCGEFPRAAVRPRPEAPPARGIVTPFPVLGGHRLWPQQQQECHARSGGRGQGARGVLGRTARPSRPRRPTRPSRNRDAAGELERGTSEGLGTEGGAGRGLFQLGSWEEGTDHANRAPEVTLEMRHLAQMRTLLQSSRRAARCDNLRGPRMGHCQWRGDRGRNSFFDRGVSVRVL